jgi:hypothetical protein
MKVCGAGPRNSGYDRRVLRAVGEWKAVAYRNAATDAAHQTFRVFERGKRTKKAVSRSSELTWMSPP